MKRSLHILADFHGCAGQSVFLTNKEKVRAKTLAMVRRAGFKIVASRFHKFMPGPHGSARRCAAGAMAGEGGITGVIIVSESHLTIHTWPERRFVNLDVFFCNYSRNNTKKARAVFAEFKKIYHPRRLRLREVWRD